jgi:hypothetical protein
MATMLEHHIAWMKKEVVNLTDQIRVIEEKRARYYSRHGNEPEEEVTEFFLVENKRKKAELEELLRHPDHQ